MRISGLATGMDTEQIIKDMMKAHRLPMEKITQKKQYLEWQLDDYRSTNRNLRDLAYKVTDTVGRQTTFLQKTMNLSNPDAVGIKATNATSEFSGTIEVHSLATQATAIGGTFHNASGKLTVSGNEVTEKEFINTKLSVLGVTGNSLTISSPGKENAEISIDENDTISSLLKKINSQTGVSAFFDSGKGVIAMSAKNSGAGEISISGVGVVDNLKLASIDSKAGVAADFTFNGLRTSRASNTFTINGFEINLKQAGTGPVTFNSSPDTDKIVESVVKFVDDYNKLIEELNAKISEPKYRNFQPLSDEQKKEMKEKEIELWEEKAKSGTLRNDPTISSLLTNLRQMMSSSITTSDGSKISLKDLGIESIKDFKENGKLQINETELRKAIAENPNKVYELFGKPAVGEDKGGIAVQFRKTMDDTVKVISAKAGTTGTVSDSFTLGRSLKSMNQQIERFEDRLKMIEDRYWKQFTAMEKAIQRANAQSANMMNMFGGQ